MNLISSERKKLDLSLFSDSNKIVLRTRRADLRRLHQNHTKDGCGGLFYLEGRILRCDSDGDEIRLDVAGQYYLE